MFYRIGLYTMLTRLDGMGGRLLGVFLLAAMGQGCVGAGQDVRPVCGTCEQADRFVRLQQVDSGGRNQPRYAHPFHLAPEDWRTLLAGIKVQHQISGYLGMGQKGPVVQAFASSDVQYLSEALSRAFAVARPDERVVFLLTHAGASGTDEVTTGGWFVNRAELHLILANYREAVTLPSIKDLLWTRPLEPNFGLSYDLVPGDHQVLATREVRIGSALRPSPAVLAIAYQPLLLGEPAPAHGGTDHTLAPPTPGPMPATAPSVEERLKALNRLRDQGLITDEEYQAKRKEILTGL